MMAELIRTSLICDDFLFCETTADALNELTFLDNVDQLSEVSSQTPSPVSSTQDVTSDASLLSADSMPVYSSYFVESGRGGPSAFVHQDFWDDTAGAKVDLSTFQSGVSPNDIYGNDYLVQIGRGKYDASDDTTPPVSKRGGKKCGRVIRKNRPPYLYAGLVATAIYVSGQEGLTYKEISNELAEWFGKDIEAHCRILRKNIVRVCTHHKLFYQLSTSPKRFGVRSGLVSGDKFVRMSTTDDSHRLNFRLTISQHLNLPDMLADLKSGRRLARGLRAEVNLETRTTSKKRESESEEPLGKRRRLEPSPHPSLEMPPRPCFKDSNDDDEDDELLLPVNSFNKGHLTQPLPAPLPLQAPEQAPCVSLGQYYIPAVGTLATADRVVLISVNTKY